jgi:hypothetical protein
MRKRMAGLAKITLLRWLAVAVVAAIVLAVGARRISNGGVDLDATQSVMMAVNLAHHGAISLVEHAPYVPTDYREPIPVLLMAADIKLIDALLGEVPPEDYLSGERLRILKYENLLWVLLVSVGVFACVRVAIRSELPAAANDTFYVCLAGAAAGGLLISAGAWGGVLLNDLATDLAGAAVLSLASPALAVALTRGRASWCVAAGLLFGALTLVKAAVLYVFIGMIGTLLCIYLIWRSRLVLASAMADLGLVTAAFAVVVLPWMVRNYVELGVFQVAQRAGVVLMIRAVKDQMTPEEYRGAFYVWAPSGLQGPIGSLLGFTPRDLQRGGRLQHLNRDESDFHSDDVAAELAGRPQDAISYYRRARAERVKLEKELEASGSPDAGVETDKILQKRALAMIKADPGKHLAATLPFMWRGAALAFPILVIAILLALRYRRYEIVLVAFPSFGLVMFYALLSHFIPRYGMPVRPILVALLVVGAKLGWDLVSGRPTRAPEISDGVLRKQQG